MSINTNFAEIEQFLGIQMLMGLISMPAYSNYWSTRTRVNVIADNALRDPNKPDKLFKIRPLLELIRKNFLKLEQEEKMSIDEQIIPAKTKKSGIRQYNPKKPVKWGFKMFVRAGVSGMMYDFFSIVERIALRRSVQLRELF